MINIQHTKLETLHDEAPMHGEAPKSSVMLEMFL
jgi:hypothetical protein